MKSAKECVARRRERLTNLLILLHKEGEAACTRKRRDDLTMSALPAAHITHREVREELLQKLMLLFEHQVALEISHMAWNNLSFLHVPSLRGWGSPSHVPMPTVLENSGER